MNNFLSLSSLSLYSCVHPICNQQIDFDLNKPIKKKKKSNCRRFARPTKIFNRSSESNRTLSIETKRNESNRIESNLKPTNNRPPARTITLHRWSMVSGLYVPLGYWVISDQNLYPYLKLKLAWPDVETWTRTRTRTRTRIAPPVAVHYATKFGYKRLYIYILISVYIRVRIPISICHVGLYLCGCPPPSSYVKYLSIYENENGELINR